MSNSDNSNDRLKQLLGIYREHKRTYAREALRNCAEIIAEKRIKQGRQVIRLSFKFAVVSLIAIVLFTGLGFLAITTVKDILQQASVLRTRLDAAHKAAGLEQAFDVAFNAEQPNIVKTSVNIDPSLVYSVAVTYNNGESWQTLYSRAVGDVGGFTAPRQVITVEDQQAFSSPASGKRIVKARVRATYIPEVISAFPEYQNPEQTERIGIYELTNKGIMKLAGEDITIAKPEMSMGIVQLAVDRWEVINSPAGSVSLENDPVDGAIIQHFKLPEVGEYTNISHAIPGASPAKPTVSLEELTNMEIQLIWDGNEPIALEPKLVDDHGKTIGITKFIEPSSKSQTIRIPDRSLKGYWGIISFDFSRVRRFEIAVARKANSYAAEGTIKIQHIELIGTGKLPTEPLDNKTETLTTLPLEPAFWKTANSQRGTIELSKQAELLVCKVNLPYDQGHDETLPWTNLETQLQQHDFNNLKAIELELQWQGPSPITLEPKIVTSLQGDTYGKHIQIQPSDDFEKVRVYLHDLKYYWSVAGTSDFTKMNLRELNTISIGVARKAQDQAQQGTLYIKTIRMLGTTEQMKD
jgi:hypothetical protein